MNGFKQWNVPLYSYRGNRNKILEEDDDEDEGSLKTH